MVCRHWFSIPWGSNPVPDRPLYFATRPGNRIKVLLWDGNGVWLCQRRLHQGHFIWPKPGECSFSITQAEWEWLIAGVDWRRLSAQPPAHLQA